MKRIPDKEKYQISTEVTADLALWVKVEAAKRGVSAAEYLRGLIYAARQNQGRDTFGE